MIHVRTWTGCDSFRITDMTNAGKRGKRCRVIRFTGWTPYGEAEPYRSIAQFTRVMVQWSQSLAPDLDFDAVAVFVRGQVGGLGVSQIQFYEEEIRGIDAPRVKLLVRVESKWSGSVDESGISLSDETDQNNLPAMITHNQSPTRAYDLAAKVWGRVTSAASFHEAGEILSQAGCQLHYYCRMD